MGAALGLMPLCVLQSNLGQLPWAAGDDAEVSEDGLHRVDRSAILGAWVKPDLNLSAYRKVFFLPAVVLFRGLDGGQVSQFTVGTDEIYSVPEARQAQILEMFAESL